MKDSTETSRTQIVVGMFLIICTSQMYNQRVAEVRQKKVLQKSAEVLLKKQAAEVLPKKR